MTWLEMREKGWGTATDSCHMFLHMVHECALRQTIHVPPKFRLPTWWSPRCDSLQKKFGWEMERLMQLTDGKDGGVHTTRRIQQSTSGTASKVLVEQPAELQKVANEGGIDMISVNMKLEQ